MADLFMCLFILCIFDAISYLACYIFMLLLAVPSSHYASNLKVKSIFAFYRFLLQLDAFKMVNVY